MELDSQKWVAGVIYDYTSWNLMPHQWVLEPYFPGGIALKTL
jgi:hypothetical protein